MTFVMETPDSKDNRTRQQMMHELHIKIAKSFPPMEGADFDLLVADIKTCANRSGWTRTVPSSTATTGCAPARPQTCRSRSRLTKAIAFVIS